MKVSRDRIKKDIDNLSKITATPGNGTTRSSWSKEDKLAKEYLIKEMKKIGLTVWEDGIGTLFGRREGLDPNQPVVMVGSHYDTVYMGGKYDGTVGTIAALETMRVLKEVEFNNDYPIEMIAMNAEEGETFGPSTGVTNSRAMVGTLTYQELDTVKNRDGRTKKEAMYAYGIEPDLEMSIRKKGSIKNFIELHIEQGTVLDVEQKDIGIVEYLPGIGRYKIVFEGEIGDSTTRIPDRKDALLAASMFSIKVNEILSKMGEGITGGVNQMDITPNSNQFVPHKVEAKIEIRTFKEHTLEGIDLGDVFESELIEIEKKFNVKTSLEEIRRINYPNPTLPSVMDQKSVAYLKEICDHHGYSHRILNNGTGHDAMIMAYFTDTTLIYVPSKDGFTHQPEEFTDIEDIEKGAQVVLDLVSKLSQK